MPLKAVIMSKGKLWRCSYSFRLNMNDRKPPKRTHLGLDAKAKKKVQEWRRVKRRRVSKRIDKEGEGS